MLSLRLNDYPAFTKAPPSKIFEYPVAGRNFFAGVAGYPVRFIDQNVLGGEVSAACDAVGLAAALERLLRGSHFFECVDFRVRFYRRPIIHDVAVDVLRTADPTTGGP